MAGNIYCGQLHVWHSLFEQNYYYGALCLKLALQYWGSCKNDINAAFAKEVVDYLTDKKLQQSAIMTWLAESLRQHQQWGDGYAVSPLVRDKVEGLDNLSDFLGYNVMERDVMLHDYYVRNIEIDIENDYIDINVSYDSEDDEEDILTFHVECDIEVDANFDNDGYQYIDGANIGPWKADKVQLFIDGYGLRARGQNIDISLKKPG